MVQKQAYVNCEKSKMSSGVVSEGEICSMHSPQSLSRQAHVSFHAASPSCRFISLRAGSELLLTPGATWTCS